MSAICMTCRSRWSSRPPISAITARPPTRRNGATMPAGIIPTCTAAIPGRSASTARCPITRSNPIFSSNNTELLRLMALNGQGVAVKPRFQVAKDLRQGRLLPVMTDHELPRGGQCVLFRPQECQRGPGGLSGFRRRPAVRGPARRRIAESVTWQHGLPCGVLRAQHDCEN
ncbi:LysR substrate-binding domain-containing protein [Paracoccus bogoriensis]|uniref:LysR substrate-binding domain-containing protein n=1 Tax=Paracoccus bogoriensis TaxID=242065 RepID=UPI003CCEEA6E